MTKSTRTGGRDATDAVVPGRFALSVGHPPIVPVAGFEWQPLSALARLESGHTPSRSREDYWNGGIPWIGIRDATENHGSTIMDTKQHISQSGLENSSARLLPRGTVCLSRTASVGYVVVMGEPMATSQDFVNWICGEELLSSYLKYLLLAEQESVRRFAYGSVHQTMYYPDAKALHVCIPKLAEQHAIAAALGTLDDKITANTALVRTAGRLADAHLERSLGAAPSTPTLLERIVTFHNKRRIPLASRERQHRVGLVPYYGAAGQIDTVDAALFDMTMVLVGEDGSVVTDSGSPVVQYIWGPAWVNNHAHVLTGSGISTELLSVILRRADVRPLVTGAVQPKLSMGKLKSLEVSLPDASELPGLEATVDSLSTLKRAMSAENATLTALRDTLLPALMSGQLRVKDAERQVEDAV